MDFTNKETIVVIIVISVVIFFILRELNCWYWKINERISLMKINNELLEKLINQPVTLKHENQPLSNPYPISSINSDLDNDSIALTNSDLDNVEKLKKLMKNASSIWNGGAYENKIIDYLDQICKNPKDCQRIIMAYSQKYHSSLTEDLKILYSSYDSKKNLLSVFIKNGFVMKEYPHDPL